MFERFSTPARGVVIDAQHEARQLNHSYVGTEHLLLALSHPDSGLAHELLAAGGLDSQTARASVVRLLGLRADGNEQSADALSEDDAAALEAIGIDLDAIRAKVEESFGPGALDAPMRPLPRGLFGRRTKPVRIGGHLPFTARAKKVLGLSVRETIALHHNRIGPEHILLGLLRDGGGVGAEVIREAGIDATDLRGRIVASFGQAA